MRKNLATAPSVSPAPFSSPVVSFAMAVVLFIGLSVLLYLNT